MTPNRFFTRLFNWEYWPWKVVYFPIMLYWLWLSAKARSLFFFFAANPGIESGGMLVESKNEILNLIPETLKPRTVFFAYPSSLSEVIAAMEEKKINFPVIGKPDHGERGWMVEKISGREELGNYIDQVRTDFIIQQFIDYPFEAGVFFCRYPDQEEGFVSSVVIKELLSVKGNGTSTVRDLVKSSPRANLQLPILEKRIPDELNYVPVEHEVLELVPVGNHSRGTMFLDGNFMINERLTKVMNNIACNIKGFYYGRFDLRCPGPDDLLSGNKICILELNGAKSEPAHIYHPGYSIVRAYKDLFRHWNTLYKIARKNRQMGVKYPSFREGWASWIKYRRYQRLRKP